MQRVTYKHGYKVIDNMPDYTPEQQVVANEKFLQALYNIVFNDNKLVDIKIK